MKKIFTLSVATLLFASVFAQNKGGQKDYGYSNGRTVVTNNAGVRNAEKRSDNFYSYSARERDMQIAQINREYDRKVQEVKRKLFVSRAKKEMMIYRLEDQRKDEIRKVYMKFNDRNNRFDSRRH